MNNDWWNFNETALLEKEEFYSHLNIEDITDENYLHKTRVFRGFTTNNLGEYHDFYVQSDTLLLAYVFNNFENMCLEIYGPDPAHFLSAPGLAWQRAFKKTKVKLDLLNAIDTLLMIKNGITGGIAMVFIYMSKIIINTLRSMIKTDRIVFGLK